MGNADEGYRTDGLDDRAPVRERLRKARAQQAAFQIDHRSFRAAKKQRAAAEFVLVNPSVSGEVGEMNSGNCAEFAVAPQAPLAHDARHESGKIRERYSQAAKRRDCGRVAELSWVTGADQARRLGVGRVRRSRTGPAG